MRIDVIVNCTYLAEKTPFCTFLKDTVCSQKDVRSTVQICGEGGGEVYDILRNSGVDVWYSLQNIAIKWLALITHIWDIPGSILGPGDSIS